jgi:electron transport complex protein RnfD
MGDAVAALCFLYGMGFYYHGPRVLVMGVFSVAVCLGCDVICNLIHKKRHNVRDLSAIVTGMILPLMLPASVSYGIVATAGIFAIAVTKHPFGGTGHNVFNPAAAGFSFAAICFGEALFTYPPPTLRLPIFGPMEFASSASPAYTLRVGGIPRIDVMDILLGKYPGPMGATNILVLIACLLYLILRKTVRWSLPFSFFGACAAVACLFPRPGLGPLGSVGLELSTGLILFGGIFLLGDPVTTPKREMSKVAFALVAGVIAMLFRRFGSLEEEITFSLLLMNAAVWGFDMAGERVASMIRRHRLAAIKSEAAPKKAKTKTFSGTAG